MARRSLESTLRSMVAAELAAHGYERPTDAVLEPQVAIPRAIERVPPPPSQGQQSRCEPIVDISSVPAIAYEPERCRIAAHPALRHKRPVRGVLRALIRAAVCRMAGCTHQACLAQSHAPIPQSDRDRARRWLRKHHYPVDDLL